VPRRVVVTARAAKVPVAQRHRWCQAAVRRAARGRAKRLSMST